MRLIITSPKLMPNQVRTYRYWLVNRDKLKLIHLGVCDIDDSFLGNFMKALDVAILRLAMDDDEFKKLMYSEGYTQ